MLKLLTLLLPFLKELIIGKKEELDELGYLTKIKRHIIFTIVAGCIVIVLFTVNKLYSVSYELHTTKKIMMDSNARMENLINENDTLKIKLERADLENKQCVATNLLILEKINILKK